MGKGGTYFPSGGELLPARRLENWEAAAIDCCPDCGNKIVDGKSGSFLKFDLKTFMEG